MLATTKLFHRIALLCFSLFALLCSFAARGDEVVTIDGNGKQTRRTGTIKDLKGSELTVTVSGRDVKIPLERIDRFEAKWSAQHIEADAKYEARDFDAALALYRKAFPTEKRRWVQRKQLARVIWCYRNLGRDVEACKMFARLAADDPETHYFDSIPLLWQPKRCPRDVMTVVKEWLGPERQPAERLIAASWLLVDQRDRAIATLRELGKESTANTSKLAIAQLWRAEMLTLKESRLDWWATHVESMPRSLRAGPYFLLGESFAKFGRNDNAVLAFMRVPTMYSDDVRLSQQALNAAADLLSTDQKDEAIRLYRQLVDLGEGDTLSQRARTRLSELQSQ